VPKRVDPSSARPPRGSSKAEKPPDSGGDLDLNALIVEIDLEKLVIELEDIADGSSDAGIPQEPPTNIAPEPLADDTEVPAVERRRAARLSNSEVGEHVQVSLPRAAKTGLVNVSDSGVLIETNCQLFPGRTTDVFVKLRGERLALRASVVRSSLHSLTAEGLVYRSALHFERIIGLSERLAR
jgi:hypothetical protein